MRHFLSAFLLLVGLVAAGGVNAAVTVTFAQSGSDVVATASGTLTLPGSLSGSIGASGKISPSAGAMVFASASGDSAALINCLSPLHTGFGSASGTTLASSNTGTLFGFSPLGYVYLPPGFVSGGAINSTVTFPSIPVAALGLNAGNTVYTCGTDTITVVGSLPAPTVTSVSPILGSTAGGDTITITGTNFTGATSVTIGGTACSSFTVVSATSISCTTPAGTAGAASILVTTSGGTNAANTLFTYSASPSAVPTLSEWAKLMLSLMVIGVAWHFHNDRQIS